MTSAVEEKIQTEIQEMKKEIKEEIETGMRNEIQSVKEEMRAIRDEIIAKLDRRN